MAITVLLSAAACGDDGSQTTVNPDAMGTDDESTLTAAELAAQRAAEARCRGAWEPLFGHINVESVAPQRIASSGDAIVYQLGLGTAEQSVIRAFPMAEPGPPVTLVNDWYSNLWVEDSRLFYTSATPRLSSVPMQGGAPQLEIAVEPDPAAVEGAITELTPEHLYWLDAIPTSSGVWRAVLHRVPRGGGERELVAELDGPYLRLQRAEGDRMIAWSFGAAAVVESDGSVRYPFDPAPGVRVLGADSSAVYIADEGPLGDGSIWRVPVDGSEREPFLPGRDFPVLHIWSDGAGEWLVHSVDYPPSGEQRVRLHTVSSDGRAELLACDPLTEGALELSNPIFTDDAVYVAAQYAEMWQLVRVSREPGN